MKKKYKTRNKLIKWFTIIVVLAFLVTVIGSGIVSFISISSTRRKSVLNNSVKKWDLEVNTIASWQLIQQNK